MSLNLERLRELAAERLEESRDHEEQWDFLFATPGYEEFIYLPHDTIQDWDFDPEDWGWYGIEASRQKEILAGAVPTDSELNNWRLSRAADMLRRASTECSQAFVVPILEAGIAQGYAVVDCGIMDRDPDFDPWLIDVFLTESEAQAAIAELGVTS